MPDPSPPPNQPGAPAEPPTNQLEPSVQYVDNVTEVVLAPTVQELIQKAEARATRTVEWLLGNGMVLILHNSMFIVQATRAWTMNMEL